MTNQRRVSQHGDLRRGDLAAVDGALPDPDGRRTLTSPMAQRESGAHTTMQSLEIPGPPTGSSWDERRVVHLERELDQLRARAKLLEKRLGDWELVLRWGLLGCLAVGLVALFVSLLR